MNTGSRSFRDLLTRTDLDTAELRMIPARANINNHAIHEFFCKRHGIPLERILEGTEVSPAEFLNEKLWTDPLDARRIDMNAAEAFPGFFHARTGFEEGRAFVDVMPNLHILYFRLLPLRSVLTNLGRANAKFNNEYQLKALRVRPGSALITLTPYPYRVSRLVGQECHFIRGVLHANFSLHGIREVEITERYCSTPIRSLVEGVYRPLRLSYRETPEAILIDGRVVARPVVLLPQRVDGCSVYHFSASDSIDAHGSGREPGAVAAYRVIETFRHGEHDLFREGEVYGAPHCLFEVTWSDRSFLAALLDRIRTLLRVRRVTLREMQRQIEHSNRQFFELLEQKRRTIEALQSADRQKDEFLARTAHDLRTPLNGIIGLVESAGRQVRSGDPVRSVRSLELAHTAARGLSHLVDDILDYARLQDEDLTLQYRFVDLRSILVTTVETVSPLLNGKDINLELECPDDGSLGIRADENRLFQVFFNLLGNAVKFTERGTISVVAYGDGESAVVQVSDTGIGIPPEYHDSIFETYEQVSPDRGGAYGGAGIGLTVVRRIVELHGGTVAVRSEENRGSTFTVRLPVGSPEVAGGSDAIATAKPVEAKPLRANHSRAGSGSVGSKSEANQPVSDRHDSRRDGIGELQTGRHPAPIAPVWVCDDDMLNLEVLHSILGDEGYAVGTFRRGEELLTALTNDSGRLPAAILLDVMMPGIGGLETCRLIRRRYAPSRLPVIMVTARSFPEDLQAGFDAGASDYVCKPIVRQELLARMELHLSLAQAFAEQKLHDTQLRLIDTVLTLVGYTRDHSGRAKDNGGAGDGGRWTGDGGRWTGDGGQDGGLTRIIGEINRSIRTEQEVSQSSTVGDVLRELTDEHLRLSREVVQTAGAEGSAREVTTREGAVREGATQEGAVREGAARDGAALEGAAREGAAREGTVPGLPVILEKILALLNASTLGGVSVDGERLGLSPREVEVVEAVCRGYSNGEIASNLEISENTVKRHLYNTYNKLGVDSRAQLVHKILVDLS